MSAKKTIDQVREEIYSVSNGEVKLLSDTYINSKTPLKLQCSCGEIFERSYEKVIHRKSYKCIKCSKIHSLESLRKKMNDVIMFIESKECKYISGEYKNCESPLLIQCKCSELFTRDFSHFKRGQNKCDKCWHKQLSDYKTKYTKENAARIFLTQNYNMIGQYVNADTPVDCICNKGHECKLILSQFLCNRSGCMICARENRKGKKSHFYNGGNMTMQDAIRTSLDQWKIEVSERYNWICPLTGASFEECDVHHIKSLKSIYKEIASKYGIDLPMKTKLKNSII